MIRKRAILTSVVLSAATLAIGVSPAQSAPAKPTPAPATKGDQSVLQAEAAAGQASANRASLRGHARAEAAQNNVQGRIRQWVKDNGPKHNFASYLDSATGRVVLRTNAPRQVVASLVGQDADAVDVQSATITDLYSRKDDVPSYWGGAGITANTGQAWCSSGFTVKNSAGTLQQVTAGHCFTNGTTVKTELGGRFVGTVSNRGLPSHDMERITGSSYSARIYTGGTNSTSSLPVVGAGDPSVGYSDYCHSGRTTGENCGHTAQNNFAQVCTSSGCKYPVIAFTGGNLPQGGDSGSPFYVKNSTSVWIRGMIIAGDGTTSYAEKYSRIASYLGVTIATA